MTMQILLLLLTEIKTAYLKTIIMKQKIIREDYNYETENNQGWFTAFVYKLHGTLVYMHTVVY